MAGLTTVSQSERYHHPQQSVTVRQAVISASFVVAQ
jgi:hypothetical protein